VLAAVLELDARPHDEILDRGGHQDLARAGQRRDPGRDVDGEPAEVLAPDLAFSGVQPDPKLHPERPGRLNNLLCAADGPGWTVEGGHEAVPGGVDLLAPGSPQLVSHRSVVSIEQRPPTAIAERGRASGRVDDVSEEDGGEETLDLDWAFPGQELGDLLRGPGGVLTPGSEVRPRKLDESRAVDVLGAVAALGGRNEVLSRVCSTRVGMWMKGSA